MIASNEVRSEKLDLLAEGLVTVLADHLVRNPAEIELPLNFEPAVCFEGGMTVVARLQGHGGLVDLNAADHALLALGFTSLGLDEQKSERLATGVEYFRSGASVFAGVAKKSAAIETGFKLGPFEAVAELHEFAELRTVPLRDLYRTFSVNSGNMVLDAGQATKALAAMMKNATPQSGQGTVPVSMFSVEVAVSQSGSGIIGSAGYIMEAKMDGGFRPVQLFPEPQSADLAVAAGLKAGSCARVFGSSVARVFAALR